MPALVVLVATALGPADAAPVVEVVGEELPLGEPDGDGLPVGELDGDGEGLADGLGDALGLALGEWLAATGRTQLGDPEGCARPVGLGTPVGCERGPAEPVVVGIAVPTELGPGPLFADGAMTCGSAVNAQ